MAGQGQANMYGLQFMNQLEQKPQATAAVPGASSRVAPSESEGAAVSTKGEDILKMRREGRNSRSYRPDTDKLFEVLAYLQDAHEHRPVDADELYECAGVDLRPGVGADLSVHELLKDNPKVRILPTPGVYQYVAKFEFKNKLQLLNWLDRYKVALPLDDLEDAYPEVLDDLADMVCAGVIIAVKDENKKIYYFPRGKPFLTQMSGTCTYEDGLSAFTSHDLRREIRRGEAVRLGEEWVRVSTAEDRKTQRQKADPPASVTIGAGREKWPPSDLRDDELAGMSAGGLYYYREAFNKEDGLPLSHEPSRAITRPVPPVRHGCTSDVRDLLWAPTRPLVPEEEGELLKRLREADLAAQDSGPRRPKIPKAAEKAAAKKRKRKDKEAAWKEDVRQRAQEIQDRQKAAARANR